MLAHERMHIYEGQRVTFTQKGHTHGIMWFLCKLTMDIYDLGQLRRHGRDSLDDTYMKAWKKYYHFSVSAQNRQLRRPSPYETYMKAWKKHQHSHLLKDIYK